MKRNASSIARMLQCVTLVLLAGAIGWFAWFWPRSPWMAPAGFAAIAGCYGGALALEFMALRRVNCRDAVPQAGCAALARAWLAELLQAPRVFGWRQPFRWNAVPDQLHAGGGARGRRGVVFIHGFACNRGFWTPWLRRVRATGHPFAAVNLEPLLASLDDYAPTVEQAVAALTRSTGLPPLLVCHSMGGLAARAWLRAGANAARVHHVVTIGSPHHGAWLARSSRLPNGRQMAPGSQWLRQLEADLATQSGPGFTCWYSNCDNVVFPASTATLAGADNRFVAGVAHVELGFHPRVMDETLALLDRS
jgi:triacylglycerol esterase/lipase EstA (alpha/beta hydrolase family)